MNDGIKKYLVSLGLMLPETKEELEAFERAMKGYSLDSQDIYIDPIKILEKIKSDQLNEQAKISKSESFFKRLVLAAKIADEYHKERRFGSVKFQKMVYLCERISKMSFDTNYSKQAAGPFDNKFMHSFKSGFEKQGWFKVEKVDDGGYSKVCFKPLSKINSYKKYYSQYYGNITSEIDYLINLFRNSLTEEVELVATIFECWIEILNEKVIFSEELIAVKVHDWHKSKRKFSTVRILNKIEWMKSKGVCPRY